MSHPTKQAFLDIRMNTPADSALHILEFWRDVEVFNIPSAPSERDSTAWAEVQTFRHGKPLPWQASKFASSALYGYIHDVYIGVADAEYLCQLMLHALFPGHDLSERECERLTGNGWLANFQVDERGHPKPESYTAASFTHGIEALRQTKTLNNVNARLTRASDEFAQRCHRLVAESPDASADSPSRPSLTWDDLNTELKIACQLFGEDALNQKAALAWRVVVCSHRYKRKPSGDAPQITPNFLNSFYLDDLDRMVDQARAGQPFGKALTAYLGSALDEAQRIDILEQHAAMTDLVGATHLPDARWPASSRHPLVLAQQAAVAHVLHALKETDGVQGINGPPGTGKTTLLCDVIAAIITDRASRIATLDTPKDLFGETTTIANKNFFQIKPSIVAGSSIVVTSTNNNAVKNISQELPARSKIAEEYGDVAYFPEVINAIFKAQDVKDSEGAPIEGWGVIAAALGNRGNRFSFASRFFRDEPKNPKNADEADKREAEQKSQTMKQLLEDATGEHERYQSEWREAKNTFINLQTEFSRQHAILVAAEKAALHLDERREQLQTLQDAHTSKVEVLNTHRDALNQRNEARTQQLAMVNAQTAVVLQLRESKRLNLWDRLLALFGRETRRMAARREALATPTQNLERFTADLSSLDKSIAQFTAQLKQIQAVIDKLVKQVAHAQRQYDSDQEALQAGIALGAQHFPDARFWSLPPDKQHRASIAVSPALDTLRAKIFLQAIELHRLTILANAGRFIGNLRAINGMLTGATKLPSEQRPMLWDAFFFVVPVVSTTLASFDRLFIGMGQNSLGWLLVDEAGQATPQSIAGALWRSRRAVIVGDPLQIEPVFTVPINIVEHLRQQRGVGPHWSPADLSAQSLADRITRFGSWIADTDAPAATLQRQWTGIPLRTHRRCDDPMFSVSNNIAYARQMVQGRVDGNGQPTPAKIFSPLGDSAWFDVRSCRCHHPVCEDEIDHLLDCLEKLRDTPATLATGDLDQPDKRAKIFVISPFRKVVQACRARLTNVECGTVHTFQGKETDIVFLVLGTASGRKGAGARAWAASKANLLNVAITRAKSRLYVIGDASQWRDLSYFRTLFEALPVHEVEPTQ
jgi:hypothetical protein